MSEETQTGLESAPARASTAAAVTTMGAIALVSVVAVLGLARVGATGEAAGEDQAPEPIPALMLGDIAPGEVPRAVAGAVELPVVGVAVLDELPGDVAQQCLDFSEMSWEGEPSVEYAYATPDALSASLVGKADAPPGMFDGAGKAERFRVQCTAQHRDGMWFGESGAIGPAGREGDFFGDSGYSCCDADGLATASASVEVPEAATWALQERNGWYLAYPVTAGRGLTVTWKFREQRFGPGGPPQSTITFLDDSGAIIAEAYTGGQEF